MSMIKNILGRELPEQYDQGVMTALRDAGKIVERAETERIFSVPHHPYTQGLIRSIPGMTTEGATRLHSITGNVPNLIHPPQGCRFHPRCSSAMDICHTSVPPEFCVEGTSVFCWLYRGEEEQ